MAIDTEPTRETPTEDAPEKKKGGLGFLGELPILVITALVLALVIKAFLFQAFFIPSSSMEGTLYPGDRVLVNKIPYYFGDPQRGDIIVFENPDPNAQVDRGIVGGFVHWLAQGLGVSSNPEEDFIKRVIGEPGDVVEGRNGKVFVNGEPIAEPYLSEETGDFGPETVPEGELFVMGDNRDQSRDSRFGLGTVPMDKVVGKAFVKIWPPSRWGLL
jgi:signal peptidase I